MRATAGKLARLFLMGAVLGVATAYSFQTSVRKWGETGMLCAGSYCTESSGKSRRVVLASLFLGGLGLGTSSISARAQEEPKGEFTIADAHQAFESLRFELYDFNGGVSVMQRMIDTGDYEGLRRMTQTYDTELRQGKILQAAAFLPKQERFLTNLSANAITFDVLGIGRSCMAGKEMPNEANRYLSELRADLSSIVEQEKYTVDRGGLR